MRDAEGAERPIWKILVLRVPRLVEPTGHGAALASGGQAVQPWWTSSGAVLCVTTNHGSPEPTAI